MRHRISSRAAAAALVLGVVALAPALADARPMIRGGGATSIARGGGGHIGANVNRGGRDAIGNRSGNRINNGNINVGNRTNINIDNHDHDRGWDWDDHYHPVAAGVAFGTAAAITSAAVGSMIYSLPPACSPYPYGGYSYYACGGVYYEPRYEGDKVVYVVVDRP